MFDDILGDFEKTLIDVSVEVMHYIKERCLKEFKHAILLAVYSSYTPHWWERTQQLIESVTAECILSGGNISLEIYIDQEKLKYNSWTYSGKTDRDVSLAVPFWVQEGHHTRNRKSAFNEYDNYDGRHYLEMAKELIMSDLAMEGIYLNINIMNEKPERV